MGYIIEITTKNAVWDAFKTWGPPVFTLLLGLLIGWLLDWRRRRNEILNMRSMLCREVETIQELACSFSVEQTRTTAGGIEHFTITPVYDSYLGRLSALSQAEVTKLYELNYVLRVFNKDTQEIRSKVLASEYQLTEPEKNTITYAIDKIIEYSTDAMKVMKPYIGSESLLTQIDKDGQSIHPTT